LANRRSRLRGAVTWAEVGNLLWHVERSTGPREIGRAAIEIERRSTPSAGGLHPISLVCIGDDGEAARLYDRRRHAFHLLAGDTSAVARANTNAVGAVLGSDVGCTVRFLADTYKVDAAYERTASLMLRDAGALLATMGLVAEWFELAACPLGFLGQDIVELLGFPSDRFAALGGVQISG
jgi:hypothetical protein